MGTVSFDVVPFVKHRPAPGSVYRSPQVYEKLKIDMNGDNSSANTVSHWFLIWSFSVNFDGFLDFMIVGLISCMVFCFGSDLFVEPFQILRNLDNVGS